MLRDLRFRLIRFISALFSRSYGTLDLRAKPASGLRIVSPERTHRFDGSHFTLIGTRPFWMGFGDIALDAAYSIDLPDVEMVGKGIIVSREGRVILESTIFQHEYLRRSFQNHLIFFRKLLPCSHYRFALPLINYLDRNYFHWVLESIGRLALVRERLNDPELTILVDADAPRFVRESIGFLFDVPQERIISDGHRRRKIDRCLLVSFPHTRNAATGKANVYPPDLIRWMNRTALERIGGDDGERINFIITRRNAHQRKLLNEEAIVDRFPLQKFRIVALEELSFREQVALFSKAGIIIATHGAGLADLVFARSPLVIEFYPHVREEKDSSYFFQITAALGMRHYQLQYAPENAYQDLRIDERWLVEMQRIMKAEGIVPH